MWNISHKITLRKPFEWVKVFLNFQKIRNIFILENLNNGKPMSRLLVLFTFVTLFKMHEREDAVKQLTFTDT